MMKMLCQLSGLNIVDSLKSKHAKYITKVFGNYFSLHHTFATFSLHLLHSLLTYQYASQFTFIGSPAEYGIMCAHQHQHIYQHHY